MSKIVYKKIHVTKRWKKKNGGGGWGLMGVGIHAYGCMGLGG